MIFSEAGFLSTILICGQTSGEEQCYFFFFSGDGLVTLTVNILNTVFNRVQFSITRKK